MKMPHHNNLQYDLHLLNNNHHIKLAHEQLQDFPHQQEQALTKHQM